jgi:arylsulfatase A-like enzyme
MAAMLSAVDDAVGSILAELERQGVLANTCCFFTSDNGPSRETRNWLDGRRDPYYGGTAGSLKGHKFSLFEGGIRVPGILSWPGQIPAGQVIDEPCASMDVFPTLLRLAGGDLTPFELDGVDLWPLVTTGSTQLHDTLCWEMNQQTAIRRGRWKLVLNGQLVEGSPPPDAVFLADLDADPGEHRNLLDAHPQIAAELRAEAKQWRAGIETRWDNEWLPAQRGVTSPQRQ